VPDLRQACEREGDAIVALARALVAIESPSDDAEALERCAAFLATTLSEIGASVDRVDGTGGAVAHVRAAWPGAGPRVLVLGHFDTVWPLGQLARQPIEIRDGRLYGPGVYDMKAGLAMAAVAVDQLVAHVPEPERAAVTLLATADEETGSRTSRSIIETFAKESDAVLVLEPATATGAVKTARKGVGEFEIVTNGVSSHAGVDPAAGASAVHELARLVTAVQALADPARGLTVNVGVIRGGTRTNVVAEQARALVDVRVTSTRDAARIEAAIRALRSADPRVTVTITGGVERPPMERTEGVVRLFQQARAVAAEAGWELEEGMTGGGSDGNFTAALGVPTLDGLGAVGDGAHAIHEHVVIKDLGVRTALLAGLLSRLGDNEWRREKPR
jgi:glutamate carboxypeptidase